MFNHHSSTVVVWLLNYANCELCSKLTRVFAIRATKCCYFEVIHILFIFLFFSLFSFYVFAWHLFAHNVSLSYTQLFIFLKRSILTYMSNRKAGGTPAVRGVNVQKLETARQCMAERTSATTPLLRLANERRLLSRARSNRYSRHSFHDTVSQFEICVLPLKKFL